MLEFQILNKEIVLVTNLFLKINHKNNQFLSIRQLIKEFCHAIFEIY